jgi:pimeloyl-ACP methyl ester carboxylesterase
MHLTTLDRRQLRAVLDGRPTQTSTSDAATRDADPVVAERCLVVGAHPWAGTSSVALALADQAASRIGGTVLIDTAPPEATGLIAVSRRELSPRDGWAVGTRGSVEVRRTLRSDRVRQPAATGHGTVFVDAGCHSDGRVDLDDRAGVVLVCRATIPGLRFAEVALHRLGIPGAILAAVADRRLPRVVEASAGPRVTELLASGRVVCFEHDRRLATEGLDDRPLPKSLLASASRLLHVLKADAATGARNGEGR